MRKAKVKSKQDSVVLPEFGEIGGRPFSGRLWLDGSQPRNTLLDRAGFTNGIELNTLRRNDNHAVGDFFTREYNKQNLVTPSCLEMFGYFESKLGMTEGRKYYCYRGRLFDSNGNVFFQPQTINATTFQHTTNFNSGVGDYDIKIVSETEEFFVIQVTSPETDSLFSAFKGRTTAHRGNSALLTLRKVDREVTTLFYGFFNAHYVGRVNPNATNNESAGRHKIMVESAQIVNFLVHPEQPESLPLRDGLSTALEGSVSLSVEESNIIQGGTLFFMEFDDDLKRENSIKFRPFGRYGEGYVYSELHDHYNVRSAFTHIEYGRKSDEIVGSNMLRPLAIKHLRKSEDGKFVMVVCYYKPYLRILSVEDMRWVDDYSVARHDYRIRTTVSGSLGSSDYAIVYRPSFNREEGIRATSMVDESRHPGNLTKTHKSNSSTDGWRSLGNPTEEEPQIVEYGFCTPRVIDGYRIEPMSSNGAAIPRKWYFQGSDNREKWYTLHEEMDNYDLRNDAVFEYEVNSDRAFKYYRLKIIESNNSTDVAIGRFYLRRKEYRQLPDFGIVNDAVLSSDNRFLAVADRGDKGLSVYRWSDLSKIETTPSLGSHGMSVDFSSDNSKLAVGHYGVNGCTLINVSGWTKVTTAPIIYKRAPVSTFNIDTGRSDCLQLAISPINNILAYGYNGDTTQRYFKFDTFDTGNFSVAINRWCGDIAFTPDGKYITIAPRNPRFWSSDSDNAGREYWNRYESPVYSTVFYMNVGTSTYQNINEVVHHKSVGHFYLTQLHDSARSLIYRPQRSSPTAISKISNTNWNVPFRCGCINAIGSHMLAAHGSTSQSVDYYALHPQTSAISNSGNGATRITIGHYPVSMDADPTGRFLATGLNGEIRIFNVNSNGLHSSTVAETLSVSGNVNKLRFSKDGKYLIVATTAGIFLYSTVDWELVSNGMQSVGSVVNFDMTEDGTKVWLIVGTRYIRCLDLTTMSEYQGNSNELDINLTGRIVRFQKGGSRLAVVHDGQQQLDVFETASGNLVRMPGVPTPENLIFHLSYRGEFLQLGHDVGITAYTYDGTSAQSVGTISVTGLSDLLEFDDPRFMGWMASGGRSPTIRDNLRQGNYSTSSDSEELNPFQNASAASGDTVVLSRKDGLSKMNVIDGLPFRYRSPVATGNIGARNSIMLSHDKSLFEVDSITAQPFFYVGKSEIGSILTGHGDTVELKLNGTYSVFKYDPENGESTKLVDLTLPEEYTSAVWVMSGDESTNQNIINMLVGKVYRDGEYLYVFLDDGCFDYIQQVNTSLDVQRRREKPKVPPVLMRVKFNETYSIDEDAEWEIKRFPVGFNTNFKVRAMMPYNGKLLLTPRRRSINTHSYSNETWLESAVNKFILVDMDGFDVFDMGDRDAEFTSGDNLGLQSISIGSKGELYVLDGDNNQYRVMPYAKTPQLTITRAGAEYSLSIELEGKHKLTIELEGCKHENKNIFDVTVEGSKVVELESLSEIMYAYVINCEETF